MTTTKKSNAKDTKKRDENSDVHTNPMYKEIFEIQTEGLCVALILFNKTNITYRVLHANASFLKLVGKKNVCNWLPEKELLKNKKTISFEKYTKKIQQYLAITITQLGATYPNTVIIRVKDITQIRLKEVEFISNVYGEDDTQVIQCNMRDITDRKKEEKRLVQSETEAKTSMEKLYTLFMNAPAIIAILSGPDLVYEMANMQYRRLIYSKNPMEGRALIDVVPSIEPEMLTIIKNVATKGEPFAANEFPVVLDWSNNGKPYTKYLNLSYEPLFDECKKPYGLMFFGYYVTEQVGNRQKLEDAAVAKEEFLSMASHEMRTPVTSIKGYTQVLESKFMQAQDTSSALLLSKLDEQIDNLTSLITDLFDDTKVKEGKMVLHCENLDINSVVTDAITEVQYTTTDHKITSILAPHVTVYADRARLKQVFVNLLTNAVKYSPKGKKITVISNITQDFVILNVEDFGLGIPENEYALIFTRFYRIHGKKFDTFPGLGLGLYIAADIIHRHKGTIHVESAMGKGSVFSVTLPIKKKYQIK